MLMLANGVVYTFGRQALGHKGDGFSPQPVESLHGQRIIQVACGRVHTLALTDAGMIWAWGTGAEGALGQGDKIDHPEPVLVTALQGTRVTQVAAGNAFSLARTENGQVWAWGQK